MGVNNCFVSVSDDHMYSKQPCQQEPSVSMDVDEADSQLELQLLQDDQLPTDIDCDMSSLEKLQELQFEVRRLKQLVYSFLHCLGVTVTQAGPQCYFSVVFQCQLKFLITRFFSYYLVSVIIFQFLFQLLL